MLAEKQQGLFKFMHSKFIALHRMKLSDSPSENHISQAYCHFPSRQPHPAHKFQTDSTGFKPEPDPDPGRNS